MSLTEKQIKRIFACPPVLMTKRLMLRKMRPCDADDMFEYACRPDVTRYLTWEPHSDRSYTREYLEYLQECYSAGTFYDWSLILNGGLFSSHKMIGTCGFTSFDFKNHSAEVGYVINPAYSGRGMATEAVKRVLEYGFSELELNRIEAHYIIGNDASRRVMEKCGMTFEGVRRGSLFLRDRYLDVGVCSVTCEEFFGKKPQE